MVDKNTIIRQVKALSDFLGFQHDSLTVEYHAAAVMHGLIDTVPSVLISGNHIVLDELNKNIPGATESVSLYLGRHFTVNPNLLYLADPLRDDRDTVVIDGIRVVTLDVLLEKFRSLETYPVKHIADFPQEWVGLINKRLAKPTIDKDQVYDCLQHVGITIANSLSRLVTDGSLDAVLKGTTVKVFDAEDRVWYVSRNVTTGQITFSRVLQLRRSDFITGGEMEHYVSPLSIKHQEHDLTFAITV